MVGCCIRAIALNSKQLHITEASDARNCHDYAPGVRKKMSTSSMDSAGESEWKINVKSFVHMKWETRRKKIKARNWYFEQRKHSNKENMLRLHNETRDIGFEYVERRREKQPIDTCTKIFFPLDFRQRCEFLAFSILERIKRALLCKI